MRTLAQWHSELNRIDETKLDRNFVESEEFVAILLDVLVMNSKTHQSEKTGLFARAFANFATNEVQEVLCLRPSQDLWRDQCVKSFA